MSLCLKRHGLHHARNVGLPRWPPIYKGPSALQGLTTPLPTAKATLINLSNLPSLILAQQTCGIMNGLSTGHAVINGNGMMNPIYTPNASYSVWWGLQYNPYDTPWSGRETEAHTACIASNATVNRICCQELNGTHVDITTIDKNGTSNGESLKATNPGGLPNWCHISGPDYKDHYNTMPDTVKQFGECFNRTVVPEHNPGLYVDNVTVNSAVWQCAGSGDFYGSSSWGLPMLSARPSGAASANAVISLFSLGLSTIAVAALSVI